MWRLDPSGRRARSGPRSTASTRRANMTFTYTKPAAASSSAPVRPTAAGRRLHGRARIRHHVRPLGLPSFGRLGDRPRRDRTPEARLDDGRGSLSAIDRWGDYPTWLAAIGTIGAGFAAVIIAGRDARDRKRERERQQADQVTAWLNQVGGPTTSGLRRREGHERLARNPTLKG